MKRREGRITVDEDDRIIGSSVDHIRAGDPVRIENAKGEVLYRTKYDPEKFQRAYETGQPFRP